MFDVNDLSLAEIEIYNNAFTADAVGTGATRDENIQKLRVSLKARGNDVGYAEIFDDIKASVTQTSYIDTARDESQHDMGDVFEYLFKDYDSDSVLA